jgi:hypothetical protein
MQSGYFETSQGPIMKFLFVLLFLLTTSIASAADSPVAPAAQTFKGEVLEAKDADIYTYLRLKTKDGEIWAAVNKSPVKVGSEVTISNPMMMNNFESKTLKKTFDKIVFGTLGGPASVAVVGPANGLPPGHPTTAASADTTDVKVPKAQAADARTVAEVVSKRAELKGKTVTVRAKVVKFNPGIMGKNWVHLRDGSGSAKDETHDVLVTTLESAQLGSIVTARGVVRTDIDLGSGYNYKVLIEDAKFQK